MHQSRSDQNSNPLADEVFSSDPAAVARQEIKSDQCAVIDIGSNSVRLVIYDGPRRAPFPICNEKALCGLGRNMSPDGDLDPSAVEAALSILARFKSILNDFGNPRTMAIATAAVREARNGPAFVEAAENLGLSIDVVDGAREAELAALGVVSAEPSAHGLVGDMGGGSLELVRVKDSKLKEAASLSIGPLRLLEWTGGDLSRAKSLVEKQFDEVPWLSSKVGQTLYAVGGAWRAIAKIHMRLRQHPLSVLHHYDLAAKDVVDVCDLISRQSQQSLEEIPGIARRRIETLPLAATVLRLLIKRTGVRNIFISAGGVREGLLYDHLTPEQKEQNPLTEGARFFGRRFSPALDVGSVLHQAIAPIFGEETAYPPALLESACHLVDIGAFFHPDLRAQHAFDTAIRAPFLGIGHTERVILGAALFARHEGIKSQPEDDALTGLLSEQEQQSAIRLGLALRFMSSYAPKTTAPLSQARLQFQAGEIVFSAPKQYEGLLTETPQRRLDALATAFETLARVEWIG